MKNSPWAETFFWLLLGDKTKYGFLVTSRCLLFRKVWWTVRIVSFRGLLQTRMERKGDHIKMNFDYFQIQKWMWQIVSRKSRWKKWGHLSSFHVSFKRTWELDKLENILHRVWIPYDTYRWSSFLHTPGFCDILWYRAVFLECSDMDLSQTVLNLSLNTINNDGYLPLQNLSQLFT